MPIFIEENTATTGYRVLIFSTFGFCLIGLALPYLTLPYGEGVLPPNAEASRGPNARPRINP